MSEFVTCDLLDDNADKDIQVVSPSMDGKFFRSFGGKKHSAGRQLRSSASRIIHVSKSYLRPMVLARCSS